MRPSFQLVPVQGLMMDRQRRDMTYLQLGLFVSVKFYGRFRIFRRSQEWALQGTGDMKRKGPGVMPRPSVDRTLPIQV